MTFIKWPIRPSCELMFISLFANFVQRIAKECLQEMWHHLLHAKGASKYSDLQLEVVFVSFIPNGFNWTPQ